MSIVAIDPNTLRSQSDERKQAVLPGVGFDDVLNAANGATSTAVAMDQGYQPAAVTSAAISGVAGVPGAVGDAGNAPYYVASTQDYQFPRGGFDYNGSPYPGYTGGGTGIPGAPGSVPGVPGVGAPSQDYLEKQALFQEMNDANWQMLLAQVTVNEISRDWQARSNILKTKSDAEINAVRNFRS